MANNQLEFDAIFHAYKLPKGVEECLESVVRFYPTTDIYMCVDGGGDHLAFEKTSTQFNIKNIVKHDKNILPKARFKTIEGTKQYVNRIRRNKQYAGIQSLVFCAAQC